MSGCNIQNKNIETPTYTLCSWNKKTVIQTNLDKNNNYNNNNNSWNRRRIHQDSHWELVLELAYEPTDVRRKMYDF